MIVSVQHSAALESPKRLEADIREAVLTPVFATAPIATDRRTKVLINPGGAFVVGGPRRDAGLTGRKNVVDTYGGFARQGGGALSGKDPSHVDRFGAYAARYVARNVVAASLARRCEVQLSYGVGEEHPLAVTVETFGTGAMPDERIEQVLDGVVDLRPAAVVESFGLRALPHQRGGEFYQALAAYGQIGRSDVDAPWEREDLAIPLAPGGEPEGLMADRRSGGERPEARLRRSAGLAGLSRPRGRLRRRWRVHPDTHPGQLRRCSRPAVIRPTGRHALPRRSG